MKKETKRVVYLALLSVILFSATMSVPSLYNSPWRTPVQGGAAGLMIAAIFTLVQILRRGAGK